MKKSIGKTILCLVVATAFLMPLLVGNTVSEGRRTYMKEFYFDQYDPYGDDWENNPWLMVDGDEDTYASTGSDDQEELCTSNNCSGGSGEITMVEIAAKGYWTGNHRYIILQPVFGDLDGDNHYFSPGEGIENADWSEWFDVTDDDNTHEWWNWYHVENLKCYVRAGTGDPLAFTLYCSMVKIRVTYIP